MSAIMSTTTRMKPSTETKRPLVLLVEDDPVMGESIVDWLAVAGYRVTWARSAEDAMARLHDAPADLVICDIRLPGMTGEEFHARVFRRSTDAPMLFITGFGDIDQAVRLMKGGAADYILKPFDIEKLLERIGALIAGRDGMPGVDASASGALGIAPVMQALERTLTRIADIDSTVLLTGPSGAGKEVAARFLHEKSPRAEAPFIAVNCAAIPAELVESQLFGHERGAFTGAQARHHGYLERAGEGILFLDEIGDLPQAIQAKLLRLLQERSFLRVGGESPLPFRARIIAATHVDLRRAVTEGAFREDLYYRLCVIDLEVPALAAHREDILPLANRFLAEFAARFRRPLGNFSPEAERALLAHDFPGNVRELRNRVERAVALAEGDEITARDLFPEARDENPALAQPSLARLREDAERRGIEAALARTDGDIEAAAELLAVSRSTLFDKMKRLGLRRMR